MFLNNPVTGLIIIAALFISDLWLAICALIGLFSSTTMALLLGVNRDAVRSGLFGYNGILVGCGLGTFCREQYSWTIVLYIIVFAFLSVPVQLALGNLLIPKWQVPPFTMPFNLMLFVGLLGAFNYQYIDLPTTFVAPASLYETDAFPIEWDTAEFFKAWLRGISQVYLADYWVR
jgi:urea transporter